MFQFKRKPRNSKNKSGTYFAGQPMITVWRSLRGLIKIRFVDYDLLITKDSKTHPPHLC